jgi:hypothetical protein
MRGFKNTESAARFCRGYDELRNHLYPLTPYPEYSTNSCHRRFLTCGIIALRVLEAA